MNIEWQDKVMKLYMMEYKQGHRLVESAIKKDDEG